jgi:quinolinate synthase
MGRYLQTKLPDKELILWKGVCPTHHRLKPEHVLEQRRRHPAAKFMAHPECRLEVLALADAVLSTTGFLRYAKENPAAEFIVGTETGIIPRLEAENPGKRFYPALETMVCPNMKMTNLEDVLGARERKTTRSSSPTTSGSRGARARADARGGGVAPAERGDACSI